MDPSREPGSTPHLPYRNFASYLRERFQGPVVKIPVDAGFSCPNRDGTLGEGGCIFCVNASFSPETRRGPRSLDAQIDGAREAHRRRDPRTRFLVYFQAFTNTHAPPARLRAIYDRALRDDVVALAVGTRPDCVSDEVLDLLAGYADRREVWVEFGLQSAHDETLRRLRRRHDFAAFADAVSRSAARGLKTLAHVILGLPGEDVGHERATAEALARLPLHGVKIHHLYVAEGTPLADAWRRGEVPLLSPAEHAERAVDFLERTPGHVVVQRLVSDPDPSLLLAPRWGLDKAGVLRRVVETFRRRGTRQGSLAPHRRGCGGGSR